MENSGEAYSKAFNEIIEKYRDKPIICWSMYFEPGATTLTIRFKEESENGEQN